jgi:hypothetical protein
LPIFTGRGAPHHTLNTDFLTFPRFAGEVACPVPHDVRAIGSAGQSKNQMTSDKPEKNKITRMMRRNVISLTFRNIKIPSIEPATSAGRLIAKSMKTFDDSRCAKASGQVRKSAWPR